METSEQTILNLQQQLATAQQQVQRSDLAARTALRRAEFAETERDNPKGNIKLPTHHRETGLGRRLPRR